MLIAAWQSLPAGPVVRAAAQDDAASGEWLIGFPADLAPVDLADQLASQGMQLAKIWPDHGIALVVGPADSIVRSAQVQAGIQTAVPGLRYAVPNGRVYAADTSPAPPPLAPLLPFDLNDPLYDQQWALTRLAMPRVWEMTVGADDVVVAVVDSGLAADHPDFAGLHRWRNELEEAGSPDVDDDGNGFVDDLTGWDWVDRDATPEDAYGHGSHVSGIIAAQSGDSVGMAGMAPAVQLMPLRILDARGSGLVSDLIDAIFYATDQKVDIINLSVVIWFDSPAVHEAVQAAVAEDILVVAAAGNNSTSVFWPAAYPETVAVAAMDANDQPGAFSNFGPAVDMAAPGVDILSADPNGGHILRSGTSMAAAHVSGAAALVRSVRPDLSQESVATLLRETAADVNAATLPGQDDLMGEGRLDPYAALATAVFDLQISVESSLQQQSGTSDALFETVAGSLVDWAVQITAPGGIPVPSLFVKAWVQSATGGDVSAVQLVETSPTGAGAWTTTAPTSGGRYELTAAVGPTANHVDFVVTETAQEISVESSADRAQVGGDPVTLHIELRGQGSALLGGRMPAQLWTNAGSFGETGPVLDTIVDDGRLSVQLWPRTMAGLGRVRVYAAGLEGEASLLILPGPAVSIVAVPHVAGQSSTVVAPSSTVGHFDVLFGVLDSYGNPVADGTRVKLDASVGRLVPPMAVTQEGLVNATLDLRGAGQDVAIELSAQVPGTKASATWSIQLPPPPLWLPMVAAQSS